MGVRNDRAPLFCAIERGFQRGGDGLNLRLAEQLHVLADDRVLFHFIDPRRPAELRRAVQRGHAAVARNNVSLPG